MIFTSLSPNAETDDIVLAIKTFFSPRKWVTGSAAVSLENAFKNWLPIKHAFAFSCGRSCLLAILSSLNLNKEDEVLLQAYTCVAVPDPVIWAGVTPVYVDCEEQTFTMSPADLTRKITARSKVLIIQHTFGHPAEMDALLKLAKKHKLFVIEDCAHAMGARYKGKLVGSFGDAGFFSFGRDKVLSSIFGGVAVTNNSLLALKISRYQQSLPYPSRYWILKQLRHLPMTAVAKPMYEMFSFGKALLWLAYRLTLLSKAVEELEKQGRKPSFIDKKMPNALALLAFHQFQKLERFNAHRRKITKIYNRELENSELVLPIEKKNIKPIYLRYTVRSNMATRIIREARQNHIELGDWYQTPVAPAGVNVRKVGYKPGSCPVAEKLCRQSINLPTHIHISENDAQTIINHLRRYR